MLSLLNCFLVCSIINNICVLTGKFKLRYDNKIKSLVLVSIINLNDKQKERKARGGQES